MVPTPDDYLTRRRVLGGAGVGAFGLAGIFTPTAWLPNRVAGFRMKFVSTPGVRWYPPVTERHFESSHDALASKVHRAEREWKGLEAPNSDSVSDSDAFYLNRRSLEEAKEYLHETDGGSATRDDLFSLTRGAAAAGRAVGAARIIRDDTDPEEVVEQGKSIHEGVLQVADDIDYRVGDPEVGLAHLYAVERYLGLAALNSYVNGTYIGGRRSVNDIEGRKYETHAIVTTWSSHFEARQFRHDAAQYYESYTNSRPGETTSVEGRLRRARSSFDGVIEENRQSYEKREELIGSLTDGGFARVRFRLWQFTHGDLNPYDDDGWLRDLLTKQTVVAARNALKLRAYETALDELSIREGDSIEMALVLKTKRRAANAARAALNDDGAGPFTHVLLQEVGNLFMDADVAFDASKPRDRAEAYADYLLALGHCQHRDYVRGKFV